MNIHLKEIKLNLNPCEVYEAFRYEIDTIILDSSKEDEKLSKYSFIGLNPYMTFSSFQNDGYIDGVKVEGNPFKILDELLTRNKVVEKTNIPLIGGSMGYISYDTGRIIEKISDSSDEDFKIPHMKFVFYRNIIIFDLMENKQYISYFADEEKIVEGIIEKIEQIEVKKEEFSYNQEDKFISNFTKEAYKKSITRLKEYIRFEELSPNEKRSINTQHKIEVAKIAASLISDNDNIYIGPGTTTEYMYDYIEARNVKIITNCLNIFEKFKDDDKFDVILVGGRLRKKTSTFVGAFANETLSKIRVKMAFIGANGISDNNIMTSNEEEGESQRIIINNSMERYLMCDCSKIEKEDFYTLYKLEDITALVTNECLDKELKDKYSNYCKIICSIKGE